MLHDRDHVGVRHAFTESIGMRNDGRRGEPVLALEDADRRIVGCGCRGRHEIDDGREIHVHAGCSELAAPGAGIRLQDRRRHPALREPGRHRGEAGALQDLDFATLLVGGDQQLFAAGCRRIHECTEAVDDCRGSGDTRVRPPRQEDAADVSPGDRVDGHLLGAGCGGADHEQLADPLGEREVSQRIDGVRQDRAGREVRVGRGSGCCGRAASGQAARDDDCGDHDANYYRPRPRHRLGVRFGVALQRRHGSQVFLVERRSDRASSRPQDQRHGDIQDQPAAHESVPIVRPETRSKIAAAGAEISVP